jgi:hypothetical protein
MNHLLQVSRVADHLVQAAEAQVGQNLAHLFGNRGQEASSTISGVPVELLAQLRVLRGNTRPGRCSCDRRAP